MLTVCMAVARSTGHTRRCPWW